MKLNFATVWAVWFVGTLLPAVLVMRLLRFDPGEKFIYVAWAKYLVAARPSERRGRWKVAVAKALIFLNLCSVATILVVCAIAVWNTFVLGRK